MTMNEIASLVDDYAAWLRDRTALRQLNDWIEITTPYLDRHNDYLQLYVRRHNGGYLLTDDGYILEDLLQSGCSLDTDKRQAILKTTLAGFGVQIRNDRLEIQASAANFPLRKHSLVQAMLAVNDIFYLASSTVSHLFYEDVIAWLDKSAIRYTPRVKFAGKSGYDHLFDFVVPKSSRQPERIINAINRATRDTAQTLAFAWLDTREVRPSESRAYALLNDAESVIPPGVLDALRSYDIYPVPWSEREAIRDELAA